MAVIEHGDMPTAMFGIQGLNPWNVLCVTVFLGWLVNRQRERLRWDMPRHVNLLLLMYLVVIVVGFLRAVFDRRYIEGYPLVHLISNELFNTIKWTIPALLLFDGCRTRRRVIVALVCILSLYFMVSVQVIRYMPAQAALTNTEALNQLRGKLTKQIGYSACTISAMLAGASWAIVAALPLVRRKKYWFLALAAAGIVACGQALTGGRAGYLAWGATGLVMCFLKWRRQLIFVPIAVILLPVIFPSAAGRLFAGFGQTDAAGQVTRDDVAITSGRNLVWPYVIAKIGKSPGVGYGRLAMRRTGTQIEFSNYELDGEQDFSHPHNMYLETLLDNGILGSLPIFLFWAMTIMYSGRLFRSNNRLYSAVGGLAMSLVLAQLFAGVGSQHFYPVGSTVGMWAAMFLSLRVYVEEKRAQGGGQFQETWPEPAAVAERQVTTVAPREVLRG